MEAENRVIDIIQSHTTTAEDVPNTDNGHYSIDKEDNEKFAQHHRRLYRGMDSPSGPSMAVSAKMGWIGAVIDIVSHHKSIGIGTKWLIYAYPETYERWYECGRLKRITVYSIFMIIFLKF